MKKLIIVLLFLFPTLCFSQSTPNDTIRVEMMALVRQELKTDPAPSFVYLTGYQVVSGTEVKAYLDAWKRPLSERYEIWISKPLAKTSK